MNSLAIIVARGSSKRLPRKNLKKINGFSLVYWASKALSKSLFNDCIISTEDKEISLEGEKGGVKRIFYRPKNLTKDFTNDLDIVFHALKKSESIFKKKYDIVGLVQPTTPFLRTKYINECLEKIKKRKISSVFTARLAKENPKYFWHFKNKVLLPFLKKKIKPYEQHFQNLSPNYTPNGGIWVMKISEIKKQKSVYALPADIVQMPFEYSVDIDDETDYLFAKLIQKKYKIKIE